MGYYCYDCYNWFGEKDENNHDWDYGYCYDCDSEYPENLECTHNWNGWGDCRICGAECDHPTIENGTCTYCTYSLPFSLKTGEIVTYHGSFPDALDKAEDGSVIKLLKDYDDYNGVEINKEITLDLNGKSWDQPSSASHTINANVTFTDSIGGGSCYYGLYLNSPCTFSGGAYRFININFETEDTLEDYLAPCCSYYDYYGEKEIDLSDQTYSGGAISIKANHSLGDQTCKGYKCTECGEWYGEADADNHSFTVYTETKAAECEVNAEETSSCDNGCGATDTREVAGSARHIESEWYSSDEFVHWKDCDRNCGVEIAGTREEHSFVYETVKEPTATEAGLAKKVCSVCGVGMYADIPATGETPDEPTEVDCDHLCHSDNALMKFFWKIISFFFRLFNIQQYCDCGVIHYDAPGFG